MVQMSLMAPSKETDNKLRWEADVEGVAFKLYIPKRRVPRPWPMRIIVRISDIGDATSLPRPSVVSGDDPASPILAVVERLSEHSETVRFRPQGDPKDWEIGEPYIPNELLPSSSVQTLRVEVEWDRSAGTWTDH